MSVCHRCDTPWCVNPAHLFLGSAAENLRDCAVKGRMSTPPLHFGELQHCAVLTESMVRDIKERLRRGEKGRDLARVFGVKESTVSKIKRGNNWAWVS